MTLTREAFILFGNELIFEGKNKEGLWPCLSARHRINIIAS
jgi:hypothetical protein